MADSRANLAKYSAMQDTKPKVDAATVFLVLIPVRKLSGDHVRDIAKHKGEVEAIDSARIKMDKKGLSRPLSVAYAC